MKSEIKRYLKEKNIDVIDVGVNENKSSNYPLSAYNVAEQILNQSSDLGILICGTGVGMSIAVNKIKGIRAACVSESYSAKLSKKHNNTNVLCFGSRVIGIEVAKQIVDEWINEKYEGGRHDIRLEMISKIEREESII